MRKSAWLIVILLVGMVFFLSSIPGLQVLPVLNIVNSIMVSMDLTFVRISEWLANLIPLDAGEIYYFDRVTRDFLEYVRENPVIIEFVLRKLAHIVVFFVITIALFFLLHQYIKKSMVAVILSFVGGGVISVLDEYRQTFVEGRHGNIGDVFINMIGVSLAVCLILFSMFLIKGGRKEFIPEKTDGQDIDNQLEEDTHGTNDENDDSKEECVNSETTSNNIDKK